MPLKSPQKCRLNIPHFVARSVCVERCVPRCSKPSIDAPRRADRVQHEHGDGHHPRQCPVTAQSSA
jgi:hypothetical protein